MLDALQHGRERFARRAWREAYESLVSADQASPLDPADLERLAAAALLCGRDLEFHHTVERLYRVCLDRGDQERAARCAFWLCMTLLMRGESAQSSGWLARGQRLIEERDCVERGYLTLPQAELHLDAGRTGAAREAALDAATIGERFHEIDLLAAARHLQGRALLQEGNVSQGLALLDDTMLSVVGGELSPVMTAMMYCSVIGACEEVYALSRAREWTFAFSAWCGLQPDFVFTGKCLVYRAEIMRFRGAWSDALTEVARACEAAGHLERDPPSAAFYQKAEVHRLRGEFEQAENAYARASRTGGEPQPGLALLRLAQGRVDAAASAIRRLLTATTNRFERAKLLPAGIDVLLSADDRAEARRACDELSGLAEVLDADALRAAAAQAQGAIALAHGQPEAALTPLRRASELWARLEAPYEAASARALMGQACRALGDEETADRELGAARAEFERLGALPDLARLDSPADRNTQGKSHPLTERELDVLRLIAAGGTNKAIAAHLGVSERTIDRHVSNILGKLDVPSRAAATAYGYDHKIL
jgi:DNA-binding CsgD family transcriptional regulator